MAEKALIFTLTLATLLIISESKLPKFITEKCGAEDAHSGDCLIRLAEKYLDDFTNGVPELKIPRLDPCFLKKVEIKAQDLNITFSNVELSGLKKTKFRRLLFNLPKREVDIQIDVDVALKGPYKVNGKIFIVDIRGQGQSVINAKANLNISIHYGPVNNKWRITDRDFSYKVTAANFYLSNLFDGDELLSKATLSFLNEAWPEVMKDIAPPAVTQLTDTILNAINRLFEISSPEELFHVPPGLKF